MSSVTEPPLVTLASPDNPGRASVPGFYLSRINGLPAQASGCLMAFCYCAIFIKSVIRNFLLIKPRKM